MKKEILNMILQQYLVQSYAYYIFNESLVTDEVYDIAARVLLENYDTLEHRHKHLITKADLEAGTLFRLKDEDYPNIIKGAALEQLREKNENK